ncbi:alpha/beta hydrolase [Streptomyces ipomoeae]|uniref:Hydrolase, alpha/beta domain protein n=3 Tax=Streptomyces ipomoeae TaxID=103232 RepID=L1KS87_9ACTN|nr:alpha/beta hydrolase [Streptomyces ipomoeae]EKX63320.1 hydrolase, alpha/beta domain protein [Streptomyces ipomoeae 91-03]MDX2827371.1 alpha/beta hydrolase [Streptomyces ipomoeae]MDX2845578.1 alpha/beta hydrolase [Streptomyces ipomoeae]TQE27914.1 alpha/beta hydrolase [Streptomyces ipomoeae]TQE35388.1 alpha/beta hydrolase [Streptomyces ipomoeae]
MGIQRYTVRRFGRLKAVGAALAALVVAGTGAGTQATAAPAKPATQTPPVPTLTWSDCRSGFECANADVPLDYREPQGRTITLAVIRKKAADQANRKGTLFMQPGGPGNSGVDFVRNNYDDLPAALRDSFDVFGYDVRGVGRSSALTCWDDARYTQAVTEAKGVPVGPALFGSALRQAADFDQACVDNAGELLPYVGTEYVARDIDLLRQALGEEQLTYYGRSFGTYIGTVYAALFPERVRALALDGAYDPVHYANRPYAYDRPQYLALDGAMSRFLDWCAADQATCGFGDGDPRAAFEKLKADLDANPVPTANGGQANGYTLVYRLMFNINEGKVIWPSLGAALRKAQLRDNTSFLLRPPSPASFDFLGPNVVVECVDRDYPSGLRRLKRNVEANAEAAPLLGPAMAYGPPTYDHQHATACVQWPGERVSRYDGSYRARGSKPILVIGTTGDPDTPYQDAVALSRRLDNGRLLTFDAEGHTAFGRSACATDAVTGYLLDLKVPAHGTTCADETQPPSATPKVAPPGTTLGELRNGVNERVERIGHVS